MPDKYIKPAIVAAGAVMMLSGVYEMAGFWGLLTPLVPPCFFTEH
jgi:hypothetical protein